MRYLIEEDPNGKYMVKYSYLEKSKEPLVDILRAWETDVVADIRPELIRDEFGVKVSELKAILADCLLRYGFQQEQWIRINIINVM
ncbi:hypothetical protein [Bacillus sp. M6-12]|uniref:hypothetical protein n=1 Tax=Bacillus sp. M6-12 TaxID=2054166 RepID=UPI00115B7BE0|nr:hypothetical protein [Bacillus sp. M6-12]